MSWFLLTVLSGCFLGVYDLAKKSAVHENAVTPVLFCSVLLAAAVWAPWVGWSAVSPETIPWDIFRVSSLGFSQHLYLLAKSALVGSSWGFAYVALKHLPISIASPIRATAPLWTILIATIWMQERPSGWQWLGIALILGSFYAFSFVGKLEGIHFHRDKWVGCMLAATLLAAGSALYDKFLLQRLQFDAATVQAWFSLYLVIVMLPFFLRWWLFQRREAPFQWRTAIVVIGVTLLLADFLYFSAVRQEGALISLISPLRRTSIVVSFAGGIRYFGERNFRLKGACIAVLLLGIFLLSR